jgi:hypothetical protein
MRILIITSDTTVALDASCCTVTVLQVKKPDLTASAIERREQKEPRAKVLIIGLLPTCLRILSFRQDMETRKGFRIKALIERLLEF